jgi:F-type H+-transporting ATPase subunit b
LKDLKAHLRGPVTVLWLAALIGISGGISFAPAPLLAQDAADSRPETAAPAPSPAADARQESQPSKPQPSKEEQQTQALRLEGPVVKWTAKTLNLSMEKTADIYEIINFLIVALAVVVPLSRFLPRYLRQRKQKLSDDLESARKMTEDANARLGAIEAKLARIDEEIQKFRAEVEAESQGDEARIKASLAEESARIVDSVEQEIGLAAAQARRGLRHFAADLAIGQAASQLNLTAEIDRQLIAEFVDDVFRSGAATGGKN